MTQRSLCLTCLHYYDGLCKTSSIGQWWLPIPDDASCPYYIHSEQGSSAEAFR